MWCHAVLHVENSISSHTNINLHMTRHEHLVQWNSLDEGVQLCQFAVREAVQCKIYNCFFKKSCVNHSSF